MNREEKVEKIGRNLARSIVTLLSVALIICIVALFYATYQEDSDSKPEVLSMTASVSIPDQMEFAGEKIVFDRYDKRERMDRELNSFTYFHSTTMLLFKRANRIFPVIEPILKRNGLPDDLKYLAVIESSLDTRALSYAGAAGLWQFLKSTGRQYGLEVTSEVDERYHIEKSTVAACRYLKSAYQKFNSWAAAAMAYNGGQGRIATSLKEQQTSEALDLWLVEETTRYYYRMLAIKTIFENPQKYGFIIQTEHLHKPIEFKEVKVNSSISDLAQFAKKHGITYAQLKDFNPWLRSDRLPNKSGKRYTIMIPKQESLYYRPKKRYKVHDERWVAK